MSRLVIISAGISEPSTTRMLADRIAAASVERLRELEVAATVVPLEVAPLAVDVARASVTGVSSPELQAAIEQIAGADAVVAATPVYKAGVSGLFKSFVDLLDDDLLIAKPVVLAATAGSSRHALVVDEQMRSLFAYLRALTMPPLFSPLRKTGVRTTSASVSSVPRPSSPSSSEGRSSRESPIAPGPAIGTSSRATRPAPSRRPPMSISTRR
jgi:LLM-partnered FMN reductase